MDPFITGGGQQFGMRSGTESPALAIGFKTACDKISSCNLTLAGKQTKALRDNFEKELQRNCPDVTIASLGAFRLPNTSLIIFSDMEGEMAVHRLLELGVIASTGSACSSGADTPSHVLLAMDVNFDSARNALRVSFEMNQRIDPLSLAKIFSSAYQEIV